MSLVVEFVLGASTSTGPLFRGLAGVTQGVPRPVLGQGEINHGIVSLVVEFVLGASTSTGALFRWGVKNHIAQAA